MVEGQQNIDGVSAICPLSARSRFVFEAESTAYCVVRVCVCVFVLVYLSANCRYTRRDWIEFVPNQSSSFESFFPLFVVLLMVRNGHKTYNSELRYQRFTTFTLTKSFEHHSYNKKNVIQSIWQIGLLAPYIYIHDIPNYTNCRPKNKNNIPNKKFKPKNDLKPYMNVLGLSKNSQ